MMMDILYEVSNIFNWRIFRVWDRIALMIMGLVTISFLSNLAYGDTTIIVWFMTLWIIFGLTGSIFNYFKLGDRRIVHDSNKR